MGQVESDMAACPQENINCFASSESNKFAYKVFFEGGDDDPLYDSWYRSVAVAAIKAARAGIPLMEATYVMPEYMPIHIEESHDGMLGIEEVTEVAVEEVHIADLASSSDSISDMVFRIAQCAYVCGQQEQGSCPIFTDFKPR